MPVPCQLSQIDRLSDDSDRVLAKLGKQSDKVVTIQFRLGTKHAGTLIHLYFVQQKFDFFLFMAHPAIFSDP